MFRFGWEKVDAKLIDQRFLRRDSYNANKGGSGYQVWEYMVELPGADGRPVRLTIEEKTFKLKDPQVGDTVPEEKARKARDEARFEAKRRGLD